MRTKRLMAVLLTTLLLFGSIFPSMSLAAAPSISVTLDKTTASVGDIVTATISVNGIQNFAGYQANIKYDPAVLQPLYSETEPYDSSSVPDYGTLLQKRYSPTDMASNDLVNGTLTFGRTYMNLEGYKNSGNPESTGTLAIIKFKVLKKAATQIKLQNAPSLTNPVDGTMVFDWTGTQLSNYTVEQAPILNNDGTQPSTEPSTQPSTQPSPITGSGVIATVDKTTASVGDIITYTISVKDIAGFAGYQANVKYDPSVLQPIYDDGMAYDSSSVPEYGTLLQKRYSPTDMASNDLTKGTLTFGRTYMNLESYKNSGSAETTGSIAVIRFKVLKTTATGIWLQNAASLTNAVDGTMLFDWSGTQLSGYQVQQAPSINGTVVIPSSEPSTPPMDGSGVIATVNKTTASVGDIITYTISVKDIAGFAGYQANVKYDPSVLQPVYTDGGAYDSSAVPEVGELLQKRYSPTDMASNDLTKGTLTFGRTYMNLEGYKASGTAETTGSIAIIGFKVLKTTPTIILLENASSLTNAVDGTMLFDWSGAQLSGYKVQQAPSINGTVTTTSKPSNTPTKPATPTKPTNTPTNTPAPVNSDLKLLFSNNGAAASSNQIYLNMKLQNTGSSTYDLSKITIRYYYKSDDDKALTYYSDYVSIGSASATFNNLSPAHAKADKYIEIKLASGTLAAAGSQWPNQSEVTVQGRVAKADWTNLDQSNDYSYPGPMSQFSENKNVTVYYNGVLVYGTPPTGAENTPTNTPTKSANPTPTKSTNPTPTKDNTVPVDGTVSLSVDKTTVAAGEIVTATLKINGITGFAGYQANIKYDPSMLKPIYSDGTDYDDSSVPEAGELLQKRYSPTDMAANDLSKGTLTFGRTYMNLESYKASGTAETTGSIAVIKFKALKSSGSTTIKLENAASLTSAIDGTMLFNWDGAQLGGYKVNPSSVTVKFGSGVTKGEVYVTLDKTTAAVGEIVTATINVKEFDVISGYQANIKYDPSVLQPVYDDGTLYDSSSVPDVGTLLQKRYSPTDMASNDLTKGTLTFGRTYMNLESYKASGSPENTGSLAVISFKVLKNTETKIELADAPSLTNAVDGTMLFDWDGNQLDNYKVTQAPVLNGKDVATPTTSVPTPTNDIPKKGEVYVTLDKTKAAVGEIVTATINVKEFDVISGYQANIKYDPSVLQPVYDDGTPYDGSSVPDPGTLLKKRYSPTDMGSNDLVNGTLTFGRSYMNMASYKASGEPENTGSLAVICFKVLKNTETKIELADAPSLTNAVEGTMLFDWDGEQLANYKVTQAPVLNGKEATPTPTTATATPTTATATPTTATATPTTATPTPTTSTSPDEGAVLTTIDNDKVGVGDKVTLTVSIQNIPNFSGYQFNIKYNTEYLQPWDTFEDAAYTDSVMPDYGDLLNGRYNPTDMAKHDLTNGILSFGRLYLNLSGYKASGKPESTGSVAKVTFKVIKEIPAGGIKLATFENGSSMTNGVEGTMLFDWDGNMYDASAYKVVQPGLIYPKGGTINVLYGDVDGDGNVDSDDYAYMRQWLIGMITEFPGGEAGRANADVDGNGRIDSDDYAYMRQWLIGMITEFPAEKNK